MSISKEIRSRVLNRVIEGKSYVQVARELGISLGSVHNIVEEGRMSNRDFDELRRLNKSLKKSNLTVHAVREGVELEQILSGYGLTLNDLGDYLSLTEGFLSENELEPDFIGYALRFKRLSEENGMSYSAFIKDCERKKEEAKNAKRRTAQEKANLKALRNQLKQAEIALSAETVKVRRFTSLHAGLEKMGPAKLRKLVNFVPKFEALGYNVKEVSKLADLKAKLTELRIDPDKLEEEMTEQSSLIRENAQITNTVQEGKRQNKRLIEQSEALLNRNRRLRGIDQVINTRAMPLPCKHCGAPINVKLEYDVFYSKMIRQNMFAAVVCPRCGTNQQFTGLDIIFQVALLIIPRTVTIPI